MGPSGRTCHPPFSVVGTDSPRTGRIAPRSSITESPVLSSFSTSPTPPAFPAPARASMLLKIAGSPGTPATIFFLAAGCPPSVTVAPGGAVRAGAQAARTRAHIVQAMERDPSLVTEALRSNGGSVLRSVTGQPRRVNRDSGLQWRHLRTGLI